MALCFPEVKTTGYNIGHAYGINILKYGSSVGTTDVVAMEFIPLYLESRLKTLLETVLIVVSRRFF